ncbi:MAG: hypothetical protein AAF363_12295 [Bacteroidota bacterium]
MKKVKLNIILAFFTLISNSSFGQEKRTLQANLSGIPLFDFNQGYSGFVINPGFRYQVGEKTDIGTNFFYYFQNDILASNIPSNAQGYGFVPSFRYSILTNERYTFFVEAGIGFGAVDLEPRNGFGDFDFSVDRNDGALLIINAGIGVNYKVTNRVGLELTIPYIKADNISNPFFNDLYDGVGALFGVTYDFGSSDREK